MVLPVNWLRGETKPLELDAKGRLWETKRSTEYKRAAEAGKETRLDPPPDPQVKLAMNQTGAEPACTSPAFFSWAHWSTAVTSLKLTDVARELPRSL